MHKTQPEIADSLGVAYKTYCNVEYARHTVIRRDRAAKLAKVFELNPDETADFLAAWDESPLSQYASSMREKWKERNAKRSKAKGYDRMKMIVIDLLDHLGLMGARCACDPGDFDTPATTCDLCAAMRELGFDGWRSPEDAMAKLAELAPVAPADRDPAA